MRKIRVPLGSRSYDILVGEKLLASLGERCRKLGLGKRCIVVTDDQVGAKYGKKTLQSLERAGFDVSIYSVRGGIVQEPEAGTR